MAAWGDDGLEGNHLRPPAVKHSIPAEAAFPQKALAGIKAISQMLGRMGIGADGYKLPAHFPIAL